MNTEYIQDYKNNISKNIFNSFDILKAFAPEGSRKQTKRGEWYVKQGGKWVYEKKGGRASKETEDTSSQEGGSSEGNIKSKSSRNMGFLRELSDSEFKNLGMIGFDKISRYKAVYAKAAHEIMEEGIRLGYVEKKDYGKGKGKYTTTEASGKMSLSLIIQKIKDNESIKD